MKKLTHFGVDFIIVRREGLGLLGEMGIVGDENSLMVENFTSVII